MKLFVTFVLGALTGACVLWLGCSKTVLSLNNRLVVVDCFTGRASEVFISSSEADKLRADETKKTAAPKEPLPQEARVSKRRVMTEDEIARLGFKWEARSGSVYFQLHNPFQGEVRVEQVRVQIPQQEERPAIDRECMTPNTCFPLSDSETRLDSMNNVPASDLSKATVTPFRVTILD
jgi:hypothetical protein